MNPVVKYCFGACQGRAGIPDRCRIVYDKSIQPKIGDIVVCDTPYGSLIQQVKKLIGFENGKGIVSTQFADKSKDYQFKTPRIYGVLIKCLDQNEDIVIWERQTN